MKQFMARGGSSRKGFRGREWAKVQATLLAAVCALGIGAAAFWLYRVAPRRASSENAQAKVRLSEATREVLKSLKSPVEIRFYSILGAESGAGSLREFAARVDRLLSEYQRESDGKITVTRHNSASESDKAVADSMRGFSVGSEDCFLGIAVAQQDQTESLAKLDPEWEQALEPDLTRAIQRVNTARSAAAAMASAAQAQSESAEEVKRSITNVESVPLEQGRQILREAAMKELKAALNEIEAEIKQAQQRVSEAQASQSEAEQQAAMKELQQLQVKQAEKIKQITARFHAQATALEKLKANP